MKVEAQRAFQKDIEKIKNRKLATKVSNVIDELEKCNSLSEIRNIKNIKADGGYYRIRIGNYRVGLRHNLTTVILLRCMHRKDIYTYFP